MIGRQLFPKRDPSEEGCKVFRPITYSVRFEEARACPFVPGWPQCVVLLNWFRAKNKKHISGIFEDFCRRSGITEPEVARRFC